MMGLWGAGTNIGIGLLKGEDGYNIFKSAVTGFVGGAILGALSGNSLKSPSGASLPPFGG